MKTDPIDRRGELEKQSVHVHGFCQKGFFGILLSSESFNIPHGGHFGNPFRENNGKRVETVIKFHGH